MPRRGPENLTTTLAINMVPAAVAPVDPKRKSEKAPSFYEIPPPSPKRRRKAIRYHIKHDAKRVFVVDDVATLPVTDDNMLYAVEFICVLTNQPKANALKKLAKLQDKYNSKWFQDYDTIKVISFKKALILSTLITGKIASAFRFKFSSCIARYLAGETSLIVSPTGDIEAYDPVPEATDIEGATPCLKHREGDPIPEAADVIATAVKDEAKDTSEVIVEVTLP